MGLDYVVWFGTPSEMEEFHSPTESKARGKIVDFLEKHEKREQRFSAKNAEAISQAKVDFDGAVFGVGTPIDVTLELDGFRLRFAMQAKAATQGPRGGKR